MEMSDSFPKSKLFKLFCVDKEKKLLLNRFLLSSLLYFHSFFKKKELVKKGQKEISKNFDKEFVFFRN
jgi:hypothetical protein